MKNLSLLLFISLLLSNCSISDKVDNLKVKIDTSIPIGSYNVTAKNLIQDEDNRDMLETEEDGSLSYFFELDTYKIANAETLESLYRIEDQSTNTNFNISTLTHDIPIGENIEIEIDESNQNIFTQTVEFIFSDEIKPKKINFKSGEIEITSSSLSSYDNLYITIDEFTNNGTPLKFKFNTKTIITEDYDFTPKIDTNGNYILTIKVSGRTTINRNSTFENNVTIKNLKLISFEGDLGRQETESDTQITFDDFKEVYDIVEEFYPKDIIFNLNITKEYEELPILVIVKKAQFINGTKTIDIPLKKEFNKDRFFLKKGENKIIINNSCTVSGTDISDAFSAETEELLLSYKIITNPTDEDALSDVKQNHENKIRGDCEFPSKLKFVMPISGYVKGINYDVIIPVSFDAEEFDASELSYCLTADNQLPIDFDISIVIINKETKEILSSEKEVTNIKGDEKLSFNTKNIRTFSEKEANLFSDKTKNAGIGIYIKGNSIGYENEEIITLFSEDNLTLNLFLGIKGNFNLQ